MSSESYDLSQPEKPFWLRPPWAVLFDLIRLQRVRPWDINLSYLLTTLVGEMKREGYIDFTAAGVALFSSATIYRMKAELVLELQEPPAPPIEKPVEFLPPALQLPFRYEYTSTTVDNLIHALEEALKNESFVEIQPNLVPITPAPPVIQEIDEFMVDIERKIENMYKTISQLGNEVIPLSRLTAGLKRIEAIRVFLLVLFLACRSRIQLWQEEGLDEIYLSIKKGEVNGGKARVKV